jgi:hypothetical protein
MVHVIAAPGLVSETRRIKTFGDRSRALIMLVKITRGFENSSMTQIETELFLLN